MSVCERWRTSPSAFLLDMGEAPEGYWLDRIDNSKGYEPGNCRWVTPKQSAGNRAKGGPRINPLSLRQRAIAVGLPYMLVYLRVRMGWPEERALTTPKQRRGRMTDESKRELGLMA